MGPKGCLLGKSGRWLRKRPGVAAYDIAPASSKALQVNCAETHHPPLTFGILMRGDLLPPDSLSLAYDSDERTRTLRPMSLCENKPSNHLRPEPGLS